MRPVALGGKNWIHIGPARITEPPSEIWIVLQGLSNEAGPFITELGD
jgi:hypothetical protein